MNSVGEHLLNTSCLFTALPSPVPGTRQCSESPRPSPCGQAVLWLSGTSPPVLPAGGKPFSFSVCIFLFAHGSFPCTPTSQTCILVISGFLFFPRVRLALVFIVLLRWLQLGIWFLVVVGAGEQVAVGFLGLLPQAHLPEEGRASCRGSPLGTALASALCILHCLDPCYSCCSGSSRLSGQVQLYHIRGRTLGFSIRFERGRPCGRRGRETPLHPSLTGWCPIPLGAGPMDSAAQDVQE